MFWYDNLHCSIEWKSERKSEKRFSQRTYALVLPPLCIGRLVQERRGRRRLMISQSKFAFFSFLINQTSKRTDGLHCIVLSMCAYVLISCRVCSCDDRCGTQLINQTAAAIWHKQMRLVQVSVCVKWCAQWREICSSSSSSRINATTSVTLLWKQAKYDRCWKPVL